MNVFPQSQQFPPSPQFPQSPQSPQPQGGSAAADGSPGCSHDGSPDGSPTTDCSAGGSATHRVAVLVRHGVMPMELGLTHQMFGRALDAQGQPLYSVVTCATEPGTVRTDADFPIHVSHGTEALAEADTVIVPATHEPDATETEGRLPQPLAEALSRVRPGTRIASICTGSFVLAAAGLLDGKRATTHWLSAPAFRELFPEVLLNPDVLYTDEGEILTSAGEASGIGLCRHMVRTDFGSAVANEVARRTVVPPHRDGGQAQFIPRPVPAPRTAGGTTDATPGGTTGGTRTGTPSGTSGGPSGDTSGGTFGGLSGGTSGRTGRKPGGTPAGSTAFARAWALERLERQLTLHELAEQEAMSVRTFTRRFREETGMTFVRWLTVQRVERARQLLEETDLPIDRVAVKSGFGTGTSLRQHLHAALGVTPRAYRRTFRGTGSNGVRL